MLRLGDQLGPYVLEKKLGEGSFGSVYRGTRQGGVSIPVAIKVPRQIEGGRDTFLREAQVWVQASGHPNIVPVIDAAVYEDAFLLVSEFIAGGSLRQQLAEHGPGYRYPADRAAHLLDGVLAGLEHLHARGIIHRDLKPDNILLQEGLPRLTDFGVSRVLTRSAHSQGVSGTFLYMPPEAFEGAISTRTDLWAAGVLLHELLAGERPYSATNEAALMAAIRESDPRPLPSDVPEPFRKLVARALARRPGDRFGTAAEMRQALAETLRASQAPPPEIGPDWHALLPLRASQAQVGGSFRVTVEGHTRVVTLPAGVTGQRLTLAEQGGPGKHGGAAGTLYVTVQVQPDPRRGRDLVLVKNLMPEEAARGGELHGRMREHRLPVCGPGGRRPRLRGPHTGRRTAGRARRRAG